MKIEYLTTSIVVLSVVAGDISALIVGPAPTGNLIPWKCVRYQVLFLLAVLSTQTRYIIVKRPTQPGSFRQGLCID